MFATLGYLGLAFGCYALQAYIENEIQEVEIERAVKDKKTQVTEDEVKKLIVKLVSEIEAEDDK